MFVRRIVLVLVSSSLLAFASGCSSDATQETPSETGTSKGKGKTSDSDQADQADDSDSSDRDPRNGDDDRSPPDEPKTPTKKKDGAQCAESTDCESDFCIFQGNGLGMCTSTCDGDIDCDLGHRCVKLSNAPQKACVPE